MLSLHQETWNPPMKHISDIILLLRPHQWVKNIIVFLPMFFAGHINNAGYWLTTGIVFLAFCLASGSLYCFNDIRDRENDRNHPVKHSRPIAAGRVTPATGYVIMGMTLLLSMASLMLLASVETAISVGIIILSYYLLNIAYSVKLKHYALIDVFIISAGFVLRLLSGGIATGIWMSHWIILLTFLLALFLALAKRLDDVVIYENAGIESRRNVTRYNIPFINQAISIVASITMVCYIMYTVSPDVIQRMNTDMLYLTALPVLLGILRYLQLTIVDAKSGSPTKVLFSDRFIHLCIIAWLASFLLIIYF